MKTKPARSEEPLAPPSPVKQSKNGLLYVCIAVFFFSTSAIFVRWSQPFNAIEIAFWRLVIATLLVSIMGSHHPSTTTDKTNAATSFHFLWTGDGVALHFLHHFIAIYNHRPFP